jgi:hypothetical protein
MESRTKAERLGIWTLQEIMSIDQKEKCMQKILVDKREIGL